MAKKRRRFADGGNVTSSSPQYGFAPTPPPMPPAAPGVFNPNTAQGGVAPTPRAFAPQGALAPQPAPFRKGGKVKKFAEGGAVSSAPKNPPVPKPKPTWLDRARAERDWESNTKKPANGGFKKGGAVKKFAKGGSVSGASRRGDGCALRGKTRAR